MNFCGRSMILRQPVAVRFDQIVAHMYDVVDRKLGRAVRVEHGRLIDMFLLLGDGGFDGQQLHVDLRHVHRGKLYRKRGLRAGLDAGAVHETSHFHASFARQVRDQTGRVQHIAADLERNVRYDRFHDAGSVFLRALVRHFTVEVLFFFAVPALDLMDAAARILVQRDIVPLDKFGVLGLNEEVIVFRVVLA